MILALFVCTLAIQKGPPTTPIPAPKTVQKAPHSKRKVHQHKSAAVVKKSPYADKLAGWGEPVKDGDVVEIQFVVTKSTGERLADSKKRGLPYTFKIGAAGNDPLLDMVVKGMRVGGVRTGTVEARDAYGPDGMLPAIKPDDSLLVTVTLVRREEK